MDFYYIDRINVVSGKDTLTLKEYMQKNTNFLVEMTNTLNQKNIYKDGGSVLYTSKNVFSKRYPLLKCNTLDGNKDIYIGTETMAYEQDFCKNEKESKCTFTKTFHILNVALSNDEELVYLTIRQFQSEDVITVKIMKSFEDFKKENAYEFTFESTNKNINYEDISDIFKNTNIIDVNKTNKTETEEIQETCVFEK